MECGRLKKNCQTNEWHAARNSFSGEGDHVVAGSDGELKQYAIT
jgi:hypothetical protein